METLTREELSALDLTAQLMGKFNKIVGKGRNRSADLGEVVIHIHALQNMIMSQAAARAYPERFRLMGETVEDRTIQT